MRLTILFLLLFIFSFSTSKIDMLKQNNPDVTTNDSIRLTKHLDSLQKKEFTKINLSEFKEKKLSGLRFQLIPTKLEYTGIDTSTEPQDSIFNLTDEHYVADWLMISRRKKFFVIETNEGFLVTLSYKLETIDAIRYDYIDQASNNHWSLNRGGKIDKYLNIALKDTYSVQIDEKWNFETNTSFEKLYINPEGKIKKRLKKVKALHK